MFEVKITDIEPCIKVTIEIEENITEIFIEFGDQIRITNSEGNIAEGRFYLFESASEVDQDDMLYLVLEDENQFGIGVSFIENIEKIER